MATTLDVLITRFHSARRDYNLVVLEGLHALKHAHRFGAEIIEVAIGDDEAARLAERLAPDLTDVLAAASRVEPTLFAKLAPQRHPTGVIAIARRRGVSPDALLAAAPPAPVVYLESPAHLGNLGACVRVAAAAEAGGVLTSGPHDPWAPEAVRAAAGLHFAIPVARCEQLPRCPRQLVALTPQGEPLSGAEIASDAILAFGSERAGLSAQVLERANARIAIPMREGVSSLNLATAVGVVLYSWRLRAGQRS